MPKAATPPKRSRTGSAKSKPTLTSTKRRELLENRIDGIIALVQRRAETAQELGDDRAHAVDAGTAFILNMNKDDLVRVYVQAADHSAPFARGLDQLLTGGIWGELIAVTFATLIAVALVRGWIDPNQLPGPLRAILSPSMFNESPPPSDEVQAEEERAREAAPNNGEKPKPKPATPKPQAAKPKTEKKSPKK